ncbi:CRAL-TRIO domain-containing protein [Biscogniauxia mediterranea]|nr:CRAL-TRIO domain-containing protein [Biscogniauxia mediterranea]
MAEAQQTPMKLDPTYDHYEFPTTTPEPKPGHPGYLTEGQQAQVHQLRMMLETEGYKEHLDTLTLLRFLRARKFDVNAAKKMFTDYIEWRKAMTTKDTKTGGVKTLALEEVDPKNPPAPINLDEAVRTWDKDGAFKAKLAQYYTQFYHKTDKVGRPVYIEQLGRINLTEIYKAGITDGKMLLNLAVEYEKMADPRLPACSRKAGHLLETSCTIMDLAGVGLSNASQVFGYVQQASAMSNNYYPERLGHMYLINAPSLFSWVWRTVKGFLDPVTASKIDVVSGNPSKILLEHIPAENLPEKYGGTCKCEGGCEFSDAGPWREAEWAKPAWWEKPVEDATIENKPTEVGGEGAAA